MSGGGQSGDRTPINVGPVSFNQGFLKWILGQTPGGILMVVIIGLLVWGLAARERELREEEVEKARLHAKIDELHQLAHEDDVRIIQNQADIKTILGDMKVLLQQGRERERPKADFRGPMMPEEN